ncbi:MAG: hypothetical protein ACTSU2_16800 [Promethearchaeota archaeon]
MSDKYKDRENASPQNTGVADDTLERNTDSPKNILIYRDAKIIQFGEFSGSLISLTKNNEILFSDNVNIGSESIVIEGLKIGLTIGGLYLKNIRAESEKGKFTFKAPINEGNWEIIYAVKIKEDVMQKFDDARFGLSFPFMISFLHSHILYKSPEFIINQNINENNNKKNLNRNPENDINIVRKKIDNMQFLDNEIINHPIGLLKNGGIIIGDRLFIQEGRPPVFYDAILINLNNMGLGGNSLDSESINQSFEPYISINTEDFKYIIILGVEVLK